MNQPLVVGGEDGCTLREMMALFDAPAYVRRARQVEATYQGIVQRCRCQRDEWLTMVRTRLGQFVALSGGWERLRSRLADDPLLDVLIGLNDELRPTLRVVLPATDSQRVLRRAASSLRDSIERFNQRWLAFVAKLDLKPLNALREAYNRHYLLEKECALRSPRLAREGFRPLSPLTADDLLALLPPLPVARLLGESR
jgi:hypothetical protein